MTLTFFTNYIHHHQIPVADELYKHLGQSYVFVAMEKLPDWLIKGGYDPSITRPYIIRAYESDDAMNKAKQLLLDSDVVFGAYYPENELEKRIKSNKITFRYIERLFKKKTWYYPDIRVWMNIYKKHTRFRKNKLYLLAAGAFVANDLYHFFAYPDKIYKWGYFPDISISAYQPKNNSPIRLMWCARFLDWKHPELPILLAKKLNDSNYQFHLDMYGSGEKMEETIELVEKNGLEGKVSFLGNKPNAELVKTMGEYDIFLFTSDKGEGWGAVLNESMSQGCAVVASDMIGAAPFLIEDDKNGLLFKSNDIDSLYVQVKRLMDDRELRLKLSQNAIKTMQDMWSPKNAAQRFISLSTSLLNGQDTSFYDGPCSKALPIKF